MFRVSFLVPLPFSCPFLPSDFIVPCSSQHSYTVLFCCTEELLASSPLLLPWCRRRMVAEMQKWYQWNQARWDSKGRDKTQCFSRDWVCQGGMMERNCSYLIHLLSPPALQSTWASAQMSLNVTGSGQADTQCLGVSLGSRLKGQWCCCGNLGGWRIKCSWKAICIKVCKGECEWEYVETEQCNLHSLSCSSIWLEHVGACYLYLTNYI